MNERPGEQRLPDDIGETHHHGHTKDQHHASLNGSSESFLEERRKSGRSPVDDPWRAVGEYVIGTNGLARLAYNYQYCDDFPDLRVLTTAARLTQQ
jgi:hypothetical protein